MSIAIFPNLKVNADTYELDGIVFTRVSRVLDRTHKYVPPAGMPPNTDNTALLRGIKLHSDIDNYLKGLGTSPSPTEEFLRAVDWIKAFLASGYEYVGSEVFVFSREHRVAGTIDAIFKHTETGKHVIVDWKYTRRLSYQLMRFQMQLSWYKLLLQSAYNIDAANIYIVQIHEETGVSQRDIHVISPEFLVDGSRLTVDA
jgi:hypothetical protein